MTGNPFSITFGKEPALYISRIQQLSEIVDTFNEKTPAWQTCMLTGVRGSGKTVMLTELSKAFSEDPSWIVADLSPEKDILASLAAKLYREQDIFFMLKKAELNISAFGISLTIPGEPPVQDIDAILEILFEQLQKKGKRLLITLDEVTNNSYIKVFASSFQIFLRHGFPVFLIMTGLYENIYDLQNEKSLTFLYRAPKVELAPLSLLEIQRRYKLALNISADLSKEMALLTGGFPFAFQVLGYLYWKKNGVVRLEELLPEYDYYLSEFVYRKIWSELSETDQIILKAIAAETPCKVSAIRAKLGVSSGYFGVYRDRLKKMGLIDTAKYGYISLLLPRFHEFIINSFA